MSPPWSSSTSAEFKNEIVDDNIEISFDVKCSKFVFNFPTTSEEGREDLLEYDEDGDMVVPRRKCKLPKVAIDHCTKTYLNTAGLQIWGGCFLLTDYILSSSTALQDQYVLELGAGTGLCSIVASAFAKHVFATDGNPEVLNNCLRNVMHHEGKEHLLVRQGTFVGKVTVKLLEWGHHGHCVNSNESLYGWTEREKVLLKKVSLYLASDVIYDNGATDEFFETVVSLMEDSVPCTLYLSLEKRVNFVLDTLSVCSPAYDHFKKHCNILSQKATKLTWDIQQIETDFPQHFPYEKNNRMELWKFQCQPQVA